MLDLSAFKDVKPEDVTAAIERVKARASEFIAILNATTEEDRARKFIRLTSRFDAVAFQQALVSELKAISPA